MEPSDQFSVLDYSFFVVVFIVSAGIGLYYAIKSRKKKTTVDDYLLGGRNMSLLPVCCSLIATSISGSTIVGVPPESYSFGSYTWLYALDFTIGAYILNTVFLPVFAGLQLTSTFKYFELRFNKKVRLLASCIYLLSGMLFLPLTVYIPSLTFQRVTGIDTHLTMIVLSLLCAFYTALGGFKAVVWTDVVQFLLMITSIVTVAVIGVQSAGGIDQVFKAADRGRRIVIVNITDLNTRTSSLQYFTTHIFVFIYQFGLNQANMQRYLSLPSMKKIKISVWVLAVMFSIIMCLQTFIGLVIYANYETCDPAKAGLIKKVDQILPHFIQEKASLFVGFNGIFVAGIFSASLSTTSSYLNAMSGVIYEDFISQKYSDLSDRSANRIMKIIVIFLGILQIFVVFFIEKMGMVMQISTQCMALSTAALITLFILGVLVPKANSKGAVLGALAAVGTMLTFIIGSLEKKHDPPLPFRTDGCQSSVNASVVHQLTSTMTSRSFEVDEDDVFWLFRLSFVYYAFVGTIIGFGVGYLTSILTGGQHIKNQNLLATFVRKTDLLIELAATGDVAIRGDDGGSAGVRRSVDSAVISRVGLARGQPQHRRTKREEENRRRPLISGTNASVPLRGISVPEGRLEGVRHVFLTGLAPDLTDKELTDYLITLECSATNLVRMKRRNEPTTPKYLSFRFVVPNDKFKEPSAL
ncbi:hypothetical protein DMENIID0001_154640 [Sergentomyia squamirostris]